MVLNVDLSGLLAAVERMGAELRTFDVGQDHTPIDPIDIRLRSGFESMGLEEVETRQGLLSYEGRQVLVYIQAQWGDISRVFADPSKGTKFHVADCSTLKNMRAQGRYDRYVVMNKLDGEFFVTGADQAGRRREGSVRLRVCQNCLKALNYKDAAERGRAARLAREFSIEEFFSTYSSFFTHTPRREAGNVEDEVYSADWPQVSARFKAERDFRCESCGVDLSANKGCLHVHHRSGVKSDNRYQNLEVLCAACHREQPHHGHLFVRHSDTQLINRLRREQGLLDHSRDWSDVLAYCDPALAGLVSSCHRAGAAVPEVGVDVTNGTRRVVASLDVAWPRARLGVAIAEADRDRARKQGWEVWTMVEALEQVEQFAHRTRRSTRR